MAWFECPYLGLPVELSEERRRHIMSRHEIVVQDGVARLMVTLGDPDQVRWRRSAPGELIFVREFDDLGAESHIVVVVIDG
ncbi:MAG: hypothetical protein ACR2HN_13440 [Tepidiformaceae bacterium]